MTFLWCSTLLMSPKSTDTPYDKTQIWLQVNILFFYHSLVFLAPWWTPLLLTDVVSVDIANLQTSTDEENSLEIELFTVFVQQLIDGQSGKVVQHSDLGAAGPLFLLSWQDDLSQFRFQPKSWVPYRWFPPTPSIEHNSGSQKEATVGCRTCQHLTQRPCQSQVKITALLWQT